jgi:prevent-host-death family protein
MRDHSVSTSTAESTRKFVGVRELKTNAARILREVRDCRASYVITHRGRAVAVILPCAPGEHGSLIADDSEPAAAWENFVRAGHSLESRFRPGVSGVRILSETRR